MDQREAERLTVDQIPDGDADGPGSDADIRDGGSLQPFTSRQRQALLQAAGVKRIEREEKRQLHALRLSREACGCDCRGFCEPETCACSLAGIKCQVLGAVLLLIDVHLKCHCFFYCYLLICVNCLILRSIIYCYILSALSELWFVSVPKFNLPILNCPFVVVNTFLTNVLF